MERVESFSWRGGARLALPGHQLQRFPAAPRELCSQRGSAGKRRCLERIKASGVHVLARKLTVKKPSKGKKTWSSWRRRRPLRKSRAAAPGGHKSALPSRQKHAPGSSLGREAPRPRARGRGTPLGAGDKRQRPLFWVICGKGGSTLLSRPISFIAVRLT